MAGCRMRGIVLLLIAAAIALPHTALAQRDIFLSRQALDSLVNPAVSRVAEGAIAVDERLKNIGTIGSDDIVRVEFTLHNTTANSVDITDIRSSCSCVRIASHPQSLAPDASASVVAEFNPKGRSSNFRQSIWLYTNLDTEHPTLRLEFMGVVKSDDMWPHLPKQMGALRMSRKEVMITSNGEERITVANTSAEAIRLRATTTLEGITFRTIPEVIEPNAEADIMIGYKGTKSNITTMIVVEGVDAKASDRVIKITIKR